MAKKSSKSTRRTRAKKEVASKKKVVAAAQKDEAVIIAEGSDEPVVKETKKAPTKKAAAKKAPAKKPTDEKPIEQAVAAEAEHLEKVQSVQDLARPQRNHMITGAVALLVVLVASFVVALLVRHNNESAANTSSEMTMSSGKNSADPDKLLETGGKVCTNGSSQTNTQGSANPNSVGMMLQSVPSQQIQTPQTLSGSNDASTLQGASCY